MGDCLVTNHPIRADPTAITEETGQAFQSGELTRGGAGFGKVAHQAYPDTVFVEEVVRRLAMGAMLLLLPPRADFDHAVGGFRAVANDEVVAELIPSLIAVVSIEAAG